MGYNSGIKGLSF